jgi:hypothetical protein
MFPFTAVYFFCKKCTCCYRRCYGDSRDESLAQKDLEGDTRRKKENIKYRERADSCLNSVRCKQITYMSNLVLILVIIILCFIWSYNGFNAIGGLKRADCTLTKFYTMMEHGVNDEYHGKFIGIFGYKKLLIQTKADLQKAKANTVVSDGNMVAAIDALKTSMQNFYSSLDGQTVPSADPTTPTATIVPELLEELQVGINPGINQELDLAIKTYESYTAGAESADLISQNVNQYVGVLNRFIQQFE